MKIVRHIPNLVIAGVIYLLIHSSCANQGMPSGGPKDSIPPVLLHSTPRQGGTNFKGNEIRLTFDEYIAIDKVMDRLVISPPLQKRPLLRTKSKTLILQFNENLRDSVTYSVDFKSSVEDNNERNPYRNLRISFSTGGVFDSLRVAGMVKDAETLNPVENALVALYHNLNDSAVFKSIPDYISKTDENGIFYFDNLAAGKYHIFSINDANNNLKYDEGAEEIAFSDSVIAPGATFAEELDTLVRGADSLLITGHVHFTPEPFYLLRFTEKLFDQYLSASKREAKNKCLLFFEQSVADTLGINLLNSDKKDWYIMEPSHDMDSITLWLSDTTVASLDTIKLELSFKQVDSTGNFYIKKDTVGLAFAEEEKDSPRRRRKNKEEGNPIPQFSISDNIVSAGFDLNSSIFFTIPEPVKHFDLNQVRLYQVADSTNTPVKFSIGKDTSAWRSYKVDYKWEPNTEYRLEIDSAACENIFGITNSHFSKQFKTQKSDFYGSIIMDVSNVKGTVIIQLLNAAEKERLLQSKTIEADGKVVFDYLAPTKYVLKAIYDSNKNGKWDEGSFRRHTQPENVAYFQKVIKVRSNWEQKEPWDLAINPEFPKKIYDAEAEAQKKQEQQDKKHENTNRPKGSKSFGGSKSLLGRQ
jgi:hypothetical protein